MATNDSKKSKPLSLVESLISQCLCASAPNYEIFKHKTETSCQFVELQGIQFIGLGAVVDELTPRERVYDTLEVFRTKSDRILNIGYLLDGTDGTHEKSVETVPYEIWAKDHDASMSKDVQKIVELVQVCEKVILPLLCC